MIPRCIYILTLTTLVSCSQEIPKNIYGFYESKRPSINYLIKGYYRYALNSNLYLDSSMYFYINTCADSIFGYWITRDDSLALLPTYQYRKASDSVILHEASGKDTINTYKISRDRLICLHNSDVKTIEYFVKTSEKRDPHLRHKD